MPLTPSRVIPLVAASTIVAFLARLYGRRLAEWLHRLFSYPAYGSAPLCPHCLRALPSSRTHICPVCALPLTGFAATDPILRISSVGSLYRRGSQRLVGFGLAGVLVLVFVPCAVAIASAFDSDMAFARVAILGAAPWAFILVKGLRSTWLNRHLFRTGA